MLLPKKLASYCAKVRSGDRPRKFRTSPAPISCPGKFSDSGQGPVKSTVPNRGAGGFPIGGNKRVADGEWWTFPTRPFICDGRFRALD